MVSSLQTGNAELVNPATPPSSPSSPKPVRNLVLAALAGLAFGVLAALLIQRFDRRIGGAGDMEEILHTRVLGDIPRSRRLRWRSGAAGGDDLGDEEREAFRVLRTNLTYFSVDEALDSVLVTSALPGEGKTTVAIHVAQAFAESGARTLLLEADLRRPTLAARLKLGASPGLTGALIGDTSPEAAVVRIPTAGAYATRNGGSAPPGAIGPSRLLEVLPAGAVPPNPADVFESRAFDDLFTRLRSAYDIVVVDGPPVLGLSDTTPLSRRVSGTLIVARFGVATTTNQRALERQLSLVGARVLGLAMNDAPATNAGNYYLSSGLREDHGLIPPIAGHAETDSPLVSLIATVRDEEASIDQFVSAISNQTRPPDEVVIVDGGSQDRTLEILRSAVGSDPRWRIIEAPGANIARGRNIAIAAASCPVIAVTDAGASADPDWLEKLMEPMSEPGIDVSSGFFRAGGETWFERSLATIIVPHVSELDPVTFLPRASRSVAFRRRALEQSGGYPEWLSTPARSSWISR